MPTPAHVLLLLSPIPLTVISLSIPLNLASKLKSSLFNACLYSTYPFNLTAPKLCVPLNPTVAFVWL